VTITVKRSLPYVLVGGGWAGLRPLGLRRDYVATVNGTEVKNTCKGTLEARVRTLLRRSGFTGKVSFTYEDTE